MRKNVALRANGSPTSEAAIFARLWEGETGRLPVPLARQVLKLGFREADLARMQELAERNSTGVISPAELEEYDNYVKVADLLAILQSKARQVLRRSIPKAGRE